MCVCTQAGNQATRHPLMEEDNVESTISLVPPAWEGGLRPSTPPEGVLESESCKTLSLGLKQKSSCKASSCGQKNVDLNTDDEQSNLTNNLPVTVGSLLLNLGEPSSSASNAEVCDQDGDFESKCLHVLDITPNKDLEGEALVQTTGYKEKILCTLDPAQNSVCGPTTIDSPSNLSTSGSISNFLSRMTSDLLQPSMEGANVDIERQQQRKSDPILSEDHKGVSDMDLVDIPIAIESVEAAPWSPAAPSRSSCSHLTLSQKPIQGPCVTVGVTADSEDSKGRDSNFVFEPQLGATSNADSREWVACFTPQGHPYRYNPTTGESQWVDLAEESLLRGGNRGASDDNMEEEEESREDKLEIKTGGPVEEGPWAQTQRRKETGKECGITDFAMNEGNSSLDLTNPDSRNAAGQSALHLAASRLSPDGLRILLGIGADVNALDCSNKTALHAACEACGSYEGAAHTSDAYTRMSREYSKGGYDYKAEQPEQQRRILSVSFLLGAGANVDQQDVDGNTPLHIAAREGHVEVMQLLVKRTLAEGVGVWNDVGRDMSDSPLVQHDKSLGTTELAIRIPKPEIISSEVESRRSKSRQDSSLEESQTDEKGENGNAPGSEWIAYRTEEGDIYYYNTLTGVSEWQQPERKMKYIDPTLSQCAENPQDKGQLGIAVDCVGTEVEIGSVIESGEIEYSVWTAGRYTPHQEATGDSTQVEAEGQATAEGGMEDEVIKDGNVARRGQVMHASVRKEVQSPVVVWKHFFEEAIDGVARDITKGSDRIHGEQPRRFLGRGNSEAADSVFERGGSLRRSNQGPKKGPVSWPESFPDSEYGQIMGTALAGTSPVSCQDLNAALFAACVAARPHDVEALLSAGAFPCVLDVAHRTPLHHACHQADVSSATLLCQFGADPGQSDIQGNTPLIIAAARGAPLCLRMLLDLEENINHSNCDGDTALHLAVRHGNLACVQILVESGGNLNQLNNLNLTPREGALTVNPRQQRLPRSLRLTLAFMEEAEGNAKEVKQVLNRDYVKDRKRLAGKGSIYSSRSGRERTERGRDEVGKGEGLEVPRQKAHHNVVREYGLDMEETDRHTMDDPRAVKRQPRGSDLSCLSNAENGSVPTDAHSRGTRFLTELQLSSSGSWESCTDDQDILVPPMEDWENGELSKEQGSKFKRPEINPLKSTNHCTGYCDGLDKTSKTSVFSSAEPDPRFLCPEDENEEEEEGEEKEEEEEEEEEEDGDEDDDEEEEEEKKVWRQLANTKSGAGPGAEERLEAANDPKISSKAVGGRLWRALARAVDYIFRQSSSSRGEICGGGRDSPVFRSERQIGEVECGNEDTGSRGGNEDLTSCLPPWASQGRPPTDAELKAMGARGKSSRVPSFRSPHLRNSSRNDKFQGGMRVREGTSRTLQGTETGSDLDRPMFFRSTMPLPLQPMEPPQDVLVAMRRKKRYNQPLKSLVLAGSDLEGDDVKLLRGNCREGADGGCGIRSKNGYDKTEGVNKRRQRKVLTPPHDLVVALEEARQLQQQQEQLWQHCQPQDREQRKMTLNSGLQRTEEFEDYSFFRSDQEDSGRGNRSTDHPWPASRTPTSSVRGGGNASTYSLSGTGGSDHARSGRDVYVDYLQDHYRRVGRKSRSSET